ncbi:MAG: AtpZ/AtpI family protein [Flavobacteriales bacterium]
MSKDQKNNSHMRAYARFSGIAVQMVITIYLGSLLGDWLDGKYGNPTDRWYYKGVTMLAVAIAIYSVIKQVTNFTNKNDG